MGRNLLESYAAVPSKKPYNSYADVGNLYAVSWRIIISFARGHYALLRLNRLQTVGILYEYEPHAL